MTCDPNLFSLLINVFNAGANGKLPADEVVLGNRENAKHIHVRDSPLNRGMLAIMGELSARGIDRASMCAYMARVIAFIRVVSDPGEASQFIRNSGQPGRLSISESLIMACAVADFVVPEDEGGQLDMRSVLDHARKFEAATEAFETDMLTVLESPCPCGSGRKFKRCCMKAARKPRSVSLSVAFDRSVTISGFGIMPDGAVRMHNTPAVVAQAFIETTYERPKGKKVIHRMPVDPGSISLDTVSPLLSFDTLFALDTNTRTIASIRVSVASIVLAKWSSRGFPPILSFAPTQAIELRNTDCSPDLVAWRMFFELLEASPDRATMGRVGLIVDAHLGVLDAINSKQSPILDDFYLPARAGLIYASSDVGVMESIANKLLSQADAGASQLLDQIEQYDDIGLQSQRADVPHAEYLRVWERS